MSFKGLIFALLFVLLSIPAGWCQTASDQFIEQIIESITENSSEDFDYSELHERLNHYLKHPLNLNLATAEQLQELVFLSPIQINALVTHRNTSGKFIELLELQSVDVLDAETIKRLLPFVTIDGINPLENLSFNSLIHKGKNEVMFTYADVFQKQKGYKQPDDPADSRYLGTGERLLTRYKYVYGQSLSVSLTMEKDAGEQFFGGAKNNGFDFYSGNISYNGEGRIKRLVLGDYSLQFGQGLSLWSGLSFGKGAAVASITKNNIGLKPYSSTNELLFLRGASATINFNKINVTPFVSYKLMDGKLESGEISSSGTTGFHRTLTELENKNSFSQLLYGTNIQFSNRGLRLGATAFQTRFSNKFETGTLPYNLRDFAGDKLTNFAAYYNYSWRNVYFFGETAHSLASGFATLNGAMASLTPKVSLILFHRNYQKDYHSFFNQAVSEGTSAVNEKGFYSGLVISPDKKTEFNFYADFFKFPWLRFRADAPSSGYELLSQFSYSPSKRIKAIVRYKFEQKEENARQEDVMNYLADVRKQNYRFEISYKISDAFQLRNRVEVVDFKKEALKEQGYLMFQDAIYSPLSSKFSGNCRFALFDTRGFNSRVYAFENDVLYSYSVPAYQNSGLRFYINGRWRVTKGADVWLRYAISHYTNVETIGSGLDEIQGNKKSDIKLQLRFQF